MRTIVIAAFLAAAGAAGTVAAGAGAASASLFAPPVAVPVAGGPYALAIADLNGDGKADLAVVESTGNAVSVLLGNGDGTFGVRTDYPTGAVPRAVAICDLNGDGKPDLAVADSGGNAPAASARAPTWRRGRRRSRSRSAT